MKKQKMKCIICNKKLTEEEDKAPYKNPDGDIICDDCYIDLYRPNCTCGNRIENGICQGCGRKK